MCYLLYDFIVSFQVILACHLHAAIRAHKCCTFVLLFKSGLFKYTIC